MTATRHTPLAAAAALMVCLLTAGAVSAYQPPPSIASLQASISQSMGSLNQRLAANQLRINGMVRQKMQDPRVRAGYAQYVARAQRAGVQPQSLASYSYNYLATGGYSRQGMAIYRANEASNQAKIASATADLRSAQAARGQAQLGMQQGFSNNQAEFGRLLRGTSTYTAPNGGTQVLPHTWQANTFQQYQGRQYFVDQSGQYHALGNDGYWYALSSR